MTCHRRALSAIACVAAMVKAGATSTTQADRQPTVQKRPNILLAIADDWSAPHASVYGDPTVLTLAW
jgi:N-sulfoglucosamine sulfohydrolase